MLIISVKDNENNGWKRNAKTKTKSKTKQNRKEQGETEAIVKGWELNGFVVHLSYQLRLRF